MELIGWISSIFLLLCGMPQAYKSIKDGHSDGVSMAFLLLWGTGEVFGLIYIVTMRELSLPLLTNYCFNAIIVSVMLLYKFYPRVQNADISSTSKL